MPPNKLRKTSRGTVPSEVMEDAVRSVVDNNRSLRSVAKEKGISKTTLIRYVEKYKVLKLSGSNCGNTLSGPIAFVPNYGNRQIFSKVEEDMLENYIIDAARIHHGLTLKMVRALAYEFATINKKDVPQPWINNSTAGEDWLYYFRKRHPNISLRQPESTSLSRATSFNRHNVASFFDNLKILYSRYKFEPQDIYNIDETGVTTCHNPSKILAEKGIKQVGGITSAERGQLVTLCFGINALGNAIPPFFVFPRVNFKQYMLNGAPEGSSGSAHYSGWMTCENFYLYMQHFVKYAKCRKEKPTLMLLDNHESHVSIPVLDLATEYGIKMLTFHPHTSHKMQPLDRSVFGPFKKYYQKACESWIMCNPGKPMTIYGIPSAICTAYHQSFTIRNIQSGFRVAGIWPLNENVFDDTEFLSAYVTDQPIQGNSGQVDDNQALSDIDQPSTSQKQPLLPHSSIERNNTVTVPPAEIRPFPKACLRNSNNKRKKGASKILTDTPVKKNIEEEAKRREEKKAKQQNVILMKAKKILAREFASLPEGYDQINNPKPSAKPRKLKHIDLGLSESSSDSDNMSVYSENECSNANEDALQDPDYCDKIDVGSYILVKFPTKKTIIHYVGLVAKK